MDTTSYTTNRHKEFASALAPIYGRTMDLIQLNQLSDNELRTLIDTNKRTCISLIMPVQQETDKRVENHTRLKNLIKAARDDLTLLDFRRSDSERLLAPAEDLIVGGHFLATESPGLAIYLAKGSSRAYQIPYTPEELVSVGPHFLIKPLMKLRLNEYYYVLALSKKGIRLLWANQYSVERIDLADTPQSLAEALRWDDPERELQWHSQTGVEGDGRAAIFHGHGVGTKELHKKDLLRYFQLLDRELSRLLTNEDAPLVLAGVDYLLPIYREANTFPRLIDEGIEGGHQQLRDEEIQRKAWKLVRPHFRGRREEAVSSYYQQTGKALASADLTAVLPAAYQGRVETLFVAIDEQRWGEYDPESGELDLHSQRRPGDSELLNLATIHTVLNNGDVYTSPREDVPEAVPIAAVLRF